MQKSSETLKKRGFKIARGGMLSCILAAVMTMYLPAMALAETWNIEDGSITVNRTSETAQQVTQGERSKPDSNPTITGSSNYNNDTQAEANVVTITAASGTTATVTFSGLTINTRHEPTNGRSTGAAAVTVNGEGNVSVELEGSNSLTSGSRHAGLEDNLTGTLTIKDSDNDGSLTATGGYCGSGIGGGYNVDGSYITITGGNVTAIGGNKAAGIGGGGNTGGGYNGNASNITIAGGNVTATGGGDGAGIGGGSYRTGSNITIEDGRVTATGGGFAAGIGGGYSGDGSNITIKNGTVTATGGDGGAGIGGGSNCGVGSGITIEGGDVIAVGSSGAAGIGGGYSNGTGSDITISKSADVSAAGSVSYNGYTGAAIGNAVALSLSNGQYENVSGTEVAPNINGLYTTGSIRKYAPGTNAEQIANGDIQPIGDPIVGTVEPPAVDPEQEQEPLPAPRRAIVSVITADENYASTVAAPVADADAAFYAAVDMQVEDLLKEINALIAEGKLGEANALIAKGLKINAGTHQGFNASTLAKLGEASRMGVAVTVNFLYQGTSYSVTIPGNSVIDPAALIDENGYCGFLNLLKFFG